MAGPYDEQVFRNPYINSSSDLGIGDDINLTGYDSGYNPQMSNDLVQGMYGAGLNYSNNAGLQSTRLASDIESGNLTTVNAAGEQVKTGGNVGGGIIGSIIGIGSGAIQGINPEKQYSGIGLQRTGSDKVFDKISQTGAAGTIIGEGGRNIAKRIQKGKQDVQAGRWGNVARDMAANFLTMGLMSDPTQLKGERARVAKEKSMYDPDAAPIRFSAMGGDYGGYAMGGDADMDIKKIRGPKGLDNVPIDGDLNNAGNSGRKVVGYAQDGETAVDGYIFSKELGFNREADELIRKYNYNKDTDDFGGDQLAMQGFMSDIGKLRDDNEQLKNAIQMNSYGLPVLDPDGNYIVQDQGIIDKVSGRRKKSAKSLVKKLGDTAIAQKEKEMIHAASQGAAMGAYMKGSDINTYGGYALGGDQDELLQAIEDSKKGLVIGDLAGSGESGLTVEQVQEYIDRYSGGQSPIKAEWLIQYADKYDVPLELALAQGRLESQFGTTGRGVKSFNPYNIGNFTAGDTQTYEQSVASGNTKEMASWEAGVEEYFRTMDREYRPEDNNWGSLLESFTRKSDQARYATNELYEQHLTNIIDTIPGGQKVDDLQPYSLAPTVYGGTLDEVEITAKGRGKHKAMDVGSIASNVQPGMIDAQPPAVPTDKIDTASIAPSKRQQKRFMRKHGDTLDTVSPVEYAQDDVSTTTNFALLGGYMDNTEMNPTGYATGGQALRMAGMLTPALYNLGFGMTQDPRKVTAPMVSTIPDPQPIDINPELRDIEKAGASARASGRARSSMAGQIMSQTAEQEAISKAYRSKEALESERDMQTARLNAQIRQGNAQMNFQEQLQNVQAEEAVQQYINTGMGQIGQVAQVLGQEALQREQLGVMQNYYDQMGEQGKALLDLERDRLNQEAKFQQDFLNLSSEEDTPAGGGDATGDPTGDPTGGLNTEEAVEEVTQAANFAGDALGFGDQAETVYGGDRDIWGTRVTSMNSEDALNKLREERTAAGNEADIGSVSDLSPEEQERFQDYTTGRSENFGRTMRAGDVPGVGVHIDEPYLVDGKPVINNVMDVDPETGLTYINIPEWEEEFTDYIYTEQQGSAWELFTRDWVPFVEGGADAPSFYDPASYMDPEELASMQRQWLASEKGLKAISVDDEGNRQVYEYVTPGIKGIQQQRPVGEMGGRFEKYEKPNMMDKVAGFLEFGVDSGFTKTMRLPNALPKGAFGIKTGNAFEIINKTNNVVPKGVKAIAGPNGEVVFVKSNAFLKKGWKEVAKAGQKMTPEKIRGAGGKAYTAGTNTFLPKEFYITGAGDVISTKTGQILKNVKLKAVDKIKNNTAIMNALGKGKEGMVKTYRRARYVYKKGKWWQATKEGVSKAVKGTGEGLRKTAKNLRGTS